MTDLLSPTANYRDPWWQEPRETVHDALLEIVAMFRQNAAEQERQSLYDRFEARYNARQSVTLANQPMQMNVVQSVIDSACAQIAGNKTDVMCLTREGDPELQARAKKLNQFLEGAFDEVKQYTLAQDLELSAAKHGTAIERIFADSQGRIAARCVEPCDFLVPAMQSSQQPLRQCFELERLDFADAVERYASGRTSASRAAARQILEGSGPISSRDEDRRSRNRGARGCGDYVYLLHGWRRGDGRPGSAHDGRYVVCTDNGTLVDEVLDDSPLPYAVAYWTRQSDCFWGLGVTHRIDCIQEELDHLCWKIQEHMRRATSFMWFRAGAVQEIVKITNQVWQKLTGTGDAPSIINMPPIDASYFQERDRLIERAYSLTGISALAAMSMKPAGIDSGKALRLYKDIANQRLKLPVDNFDNVNMQVADRMISLAKKLDAKGDGLSVMAKTPGGVAQIRWRDVDLDRDQFRLSMYPVSFLDQTPSGQLEDVQQIAQTFPEVGSLALSAMDYPDLKAFTRFATARADEVALAMEAITAHGRYVAPDPNTDLSLAIPYALATLSRGVCDNLGEDRLGMVRDYLAACAQLKQAAQAPPPQPMMQPPPGPAPGSPPSPAGPAGMPPMAMPPPGVPPAP